METVQRVFAPGDSWIYYKIYAGPKIIDELLVEVIKPKVDTLLSKRIISKWFFIRFNDPHNHLRLRLLIEEGQFQEVLTAFIPSFKKYVNNNLIWKVQLDTYTRELERYGEKTMLASEELFFRESEMIINFLDSIDNGDEGDQSRWLFSLAATDGLLNDFGLELNEKLDFMELLKESFGKEFGINKSLKKQLDSKYREYQNDIEFTLSENSDEAIFPNNIIEIKRQHTKQTIDFIKRCTSNDVDYNLLSSYVHMLMNRVFKSKNRLHEMTMYQLLYRHYKRVYGIEKYKHSLK